MRAIAGIFLLVGILGIAINSMSMGWNFQGSARVFPIMTLTGLVVGIYLMYEDITRSREEAREEREIRELLERWANK